MKHLHCSGKVALLMFSYKHISIVFFIFLITAKTSNCERTTKNVVAHLHRPPPLPMKTDTLRWECIRSVSACLLLFSNFPLQLSVSFLLKAYILKAAINNSDIIILIFPAHYGNNNTDDNYNSRDWNTTTAKVPIFLHTQTHKTRSRDRKGIFWRVKEDEKIMQNQRSKSSLNQQCRPVTTSAQTVKQMLNQSDQDPDLAGSEYVWQWIKKKEKKCSVTCHTMRD